MYRVATARPKFEKPGSLRLRAGYISGGGSTPHFVYQ